MQKVHTELLVMFLFRFVVRRTKLVLFFLLDLEHARDIFFSCIVITQTV